MQGQGIQSLAPMGGPQQKPMGGMPQAPMGGSMGGLGSVEDRVAAFRGRPEQLQQKYAMSQDLLDLLALQKIKSEKESAARQMQLAMNQQAMQNGQMPTVAQQREQEVHQLTKNELAQQRAATDQQKQQEEQEAIRQLASSGIATAPGANTVGMAHGGIIGFDGENEEYGSTVPAANEVQVDPVTGMPIYPEGYNRPGWFGWLQKAIDSIGSETNRDVGLSPELKAALKRERPGMFPEPEQRKPEKQPAASTPAVEQPEKPGYKVEQITPPAAPPQARPPAPVGGGIGKPPKLPERTDDGGLAKLLREQMAVDPAAVGRTARDEAAAFMKPTAEQEDLYRKGITEREQAYNAQFNPKNTKWDAINAWLLGAGGRRWNVLGGAGEAAVEHNKDTLAAQNKARNELQAARQGLVALQRDHLKDAVGAGTHAAQTAGTQAAHAMSASTNLFDAVARQYTARQQLAAEIWGKHLQHSADMARVQAMQVSNQLVQQGKAQDIAAGVYTSFNTAAAQEKRKVWDAYNASSAMIENNPNPTPAMKSQLQEMQRSRDAQLAAITKEFNTAVSMTLRQLNLPGGSEPSAVRVIGSTPPQR